MTKMRHVLLFGLFPALAAAMGYDAVTWRRQLERFSGGTACNGQTAITLATWNATAESAGDVTWVCGTITVAQSGNGFVFGWGGASGNPLVLNFDMGSILQSNAFGTASNILPNNPGGAILINGY